MKLTQHSSRAMVLGEDKEKLEEIIAAAKTFGWKIAFTQGTWDMIHSGHFMYLEKAKDLADILIVAVDTDELTRDRKGEDRPFDPEEERILTISGLRPVDIVVTKTLGEHKHDLLKIIKPDFFVISKTTGDEIQKDVEEFGPFVGEVKNFEPQSSNSTTAKFRKLKKGAFDEFKAELDVLIERFQRRLDGKVPVSVPGRNEPVMGHLGEEEVKA
jgi:cytidyltransferase-like protein